MKIKWRNKISRQERQTILIGSIIATIIIIYTFLWHPLNTKIIYINSQLNQQRIFLNWLIRSSNTIIDSNRNIPKINQNNHQISIENTISNSLTAKYLTKLNHIDKNHVRIEFKNIPFSMLMKYINKLNNHGISVNHISIKRSSDAGTVNTTITAIGT